MASAEAADFTEGMVDSTAAEAAATLADAELSSQRTGAATRPFFR